MIPTDNFVAGTASTDDDRNQKTVLFDGVLERLGLSRAQKLRVAL